MPKVLILGCGPSGNGAAKALAKDKSLEVTVITGCKFIEWPIAMSYVLTRPETHSKALAPNPSEFEVPGVSYTYSVVEKVDPQSKRVFVDGSKPISYDFLIVATGFRVPLLYPKPGMSLSARKQEVSDFGKQLLNAKSIVVLGGGPVGMEVAGDIKAAHPGLNVVLLAKDLLRQWPLEIRQDVEGQLAKMGIELKKISKNVDILEPQLTPGSLKVDGQDIQYDLLLPMFSQGPNTEFLAGAADVLDSAKRIKVNAYLQSEAYSEIFAIGVGNSKDPWIGIPKLTAQWETVAANVIAQAAGKDMKEHVEGNPTMVRQPMLLIGHGPNGYGHLDFQMLPGPAKCCLCMGYGGFPFCPPICCWPMCGPCACGYCCLGPHGSGLAKFLEGVQFDFGNGNFQGLGKPEQQAME
mmetsp:Transcript_56226/g.131698  ORF Transcript_56226/g.131698 Transcript_56226/m.131698 type:complete len:408 (+) Transcript_56226:55-1278(+)